MEFEGGTDCDVTHQPHEYPAGHGHASTNEVGRREGDCVRGRQRGAEPALSILMNAAEGQKDAYMRIDIEPRLRPCVPQGQLSPSGVGGECADCGSFVEERGCAGESLFCAVIELLSSSSA